MLPYREKSSDKQMNLIEFEKRLYNLLINHLNEKYNLDEYIELLEYEKNSILYYVLSHAYYSVKDFKNADKYREIAKNLNSNFDFEDDYKNVFLYIYFLFSTISSQESPFINEEIDKALLSNPTIPNYLEASKMYRENNDIGNGIRVANLGLKQFPNEIHLKVDIGSNLLYTRNIDSAWYYNELRFDLLRHKLPQYINKPKFLLQNTSAKVYIYPVTKLGDTIFFARYVLKLKQDYPNLKLFVKVNPPLKTLFEQNGITIYDNVDESMVDYQISFEGLPFLYQNEGSRIFTEGYFKANKELSKCFKEKYFNNEKLKIGIVWNSSMANDKRNIQLQNFETLFNIKNAQFYSLQKEVSLQEELYFSKFFVLNMGAKINDFSDTAAIIDNLDVIIGCDTSVTNLSGAMNKETLLVLPNHADWRWGLFEQNSDWYKSVKIYRKKKNQDYIEVFARIKDYLTQKVSEKFSQ